MAHDLSRVTVNSASIQSTFDGFGAFTMLAGEYLVAEGIGTIGRDGTVMIPPERWMPVTRWLGALDKIRAKVGDRVMRQIGEAIPKRAEFPPTIVEVVGALESINVAYHMNHQLDGAPMFDPTNGTMLDGIGHYRGELLGPGHFRAVCDNPYPCAFDMGIYAAMAARFAKGVSITHEPGSCRSRGGASCAYSVRWAA